MSAVVVAYGSMIVCTLTTQWIRKREGVSRCLHCVEADTGVGEDTYASARDNNNSTRATFQSFRFAQGAFRDVYLGVYNNGRRKSQRCVKKLFKSTSSIMAPIFFEKDIKAVAKAVEIISRFNDSEFVSGRIRMNSPAVWDDGAGTSSLVEPFINDYKKYNSNTGWVNSDEMSGKWGQVMQALSHFSYHISSGRYLLCDIQGGECPGGIILTDPVIHSREKNLFGITDLGPHGISTFFSSHRCNKYCRSDWTKPRDVTCYFHASSGTCKYLYSCGCVSPLLFFSFLFFFLSFFHLLASERDSLSLLHCFCFVNSAMRMSTTGGGYGTTSRERYIPTLVAYDDGSEEEDDW